MIVDNGIIAINKPQGMSSFFAVKLVRKYLGIKKAGHMGTLDPNATGVLLVGINKGTKLFDTLLKKDKVYQAVYSFGYETTTLDPEGEIVNKNDVIVSKDELIKTLDKFISKQMQMPPDYSAKKINGKPAYELARSGQAVTLNPKEIEIYNLKLIQQISDNVFEVEIHCSAGTYVRALGRDIAKEFATYCTTTQILRTRCGSVELKDCYTIENIKEGKFQIIPTEKFEVEND